MASTHCKAHQWSLAILVALCLPMSVILQATEITPATTAATITPAETAILVLVALIFIFMIIFMIAFILYRCMTCRQNN